MDVTQVQTSAPAKRMTLANATRGIIAKPIRVVVYGPDGVGKSTFAAAAPKTVFLGAEDGTNEMNVARMPTPETFQDIRDAVQILLTASDAELIEHLGIVPKTLALDTIDWVEPLIWKEVCDEGGKSSIEAFGFGKGYIEALDKLETFLTVDLNRLRDVKGMNIIILGHSLIKTFKNPEGDDYDRYQLKLKDNAASKVREWADCVLFANHETLVDTDEKTKRGKAVSTGKRFLYTSRRPTYDAKNRFGLPAKIGLSWDALQSGIDAARSDPASLRRQAEEYLAMVPAEKAVKAKEYLDSCGSDIHKLSAAVQRLRELSEGAK